MWRQQAFKDILEHSREGAASPTRPDTPLTPASPTGRGSEEGHATTHVSTSTRGHFARPTRVSQDLIPEESLPCLLLGCRTGPRPGGEADVMDPPPKRAKRGSDATRDAWPRPHDGAHYGPGGPAHTSIFTRMCRFSVVRRWSGRC